MGKLRTQEREQIKTIEIGGKLELNPSAPRQCRLRIQVPWFQMGMLAPWSWHWAVLLPVVSFQTSVPGLEGQMGFDLPLGFF